MTARPTSLFADGFLVPKPSDDALTDLQECIVAAYELLVRIEIAMLKSSTPAVLNTAHARTQDVVAVLEGGRH